MEKFYNKVILCAVLLIATSAPVSAAHYFASGQEILLIPDSNRIGVILLSGCNIDSALAEIVALPSISGFPVELSPVEQLYACSLSAGTPISAAVTEVQQLTQVKLAQPCYATVEDDTLFVSTTIIVKFQPTLAAAGIDQLCSDAGVQVVKQYEWDSDTYILTPIEGNASFIVDIANELYALSETIWATPSFFSRVVLDAYDAYDYYRDYQWHLQKITGQLGQASVWDFAIVDSAVLVAVLDDGVTSHEDLPESRLVNGHDFANRDGWGGPSDEGYHGMACAGLIAATHSTDNSGADSASSGVISLNPLARIVPVGVLSECLCFVSRDSIAAAIDYAWNTKDAHVLACSWHLGSPDDHITEALQRAFHLGRSQTGSPHGCPVIFASGNEDHFVPQTKYPAKLPECFAVGAINSSDQRFGWSCYDTTLDVVVPSGDIVPQNADVWSIDQMSWYLGGNTRLCNDCPTSQDNNSNYICRFGGTSAAAAMVSGIASLLLAREPSLTAAQVYDIIRYSAVPVAAQESVPDDEYGYGRVDAFRALLAIARGDVDNDGNDTPLGAYPSISDLTYLIAALFQGGRTRSRANFWATWSAPARSTSPM